MYYNIFCNILKSGKNMRDFHGIEKYYSLLVFIFVNSTLVKDGVYIVRFDGFLFIKTTSIYFW